MILQCGYLNKSAGYYHSVQNVKLLKYGWKSVTVISQGVPLVEYCNTGDEMRFELSSDNNYNINFKINGQIFKQAKTLFKVELDVVPESDEQNFYKIEEGMIVDH
jgi:hypothetical protein